MQTPTIVKHLNVLEQSTAGPAPPASHNVDPIRPFPPQRAEEALHHRAVVAIALPAHARRIPWLIRPPGIFARRTAHSAIAVVQHPWADPATARELPSASPAAQLRPPESRLVAPSHHPPASKDRALPPSTTKPSSVAMYVISLPTPGSASLAGTGDSAGWERLDAVRWLSVVRTTNRAPGFRAWIAARCISLATVFFEQRTPWERTAGGFAERHTSRMFRFLMHLRRDPPRSPDSRRRAPIAARPTTAGDSASARLPIHGRPLSPPSGKRSS